MNTELTASPRIVVGVDGSEQSKVALRWAAGLAAVTGASIDAVGVWEIPTGYGWSVLPENWSPEQDTETWLVAAANEVFDVRCPDNVHLLVRRGNTAQVLLSESEGAMMLVLGSRGHGGFAGLLLGSVSATCAEHAHVPVLVVHGDRLPAALMAPTAAGA